MSRPAAVVHRVIKAYDVRGLVGEEIDESFVTDVGAAFARLVRDGGDAAERVAVGFDMRESSPALAAAFAAGVTCQGLDVVRIGLASTDQLYFASGLLDCPGAMFTASFHSLRRDRPSCRWRWSVPGNPSAPHCPTGSTRIVHRIPVST